MDDFVEDRCLFFPGGLGCCVEWYNIGDYTLPIMEELNKQYRSKCLSFQYGKWINLIIRPTRSATSLGIRYEVLHLAGCVANLDLTWVPVSPASLCDSHIWSLTSQTTHLGEAHNRNKYLLSGRVSGNPMANLYLLSFLSWGMDGR